MFYLNSAICNMSEQLLLPGFERGPAVDFLFFALLANAEDASQIVQLRERLCDENGLRGWRIAADLLHITLHGIGAYDGLPGAVVERAKEAGAAISAKPFDLARRVLIENVRAGRLSCVPLTSVRSLHSINCLGER
jgi:hypothetical protein